MPELLLALLVLWALLYGVRLFARANPAVLAKAVKRGGGTLSLIGAGFLLLRGRIDIALGLGGLGVWLLGWASGPGFRGFRWPGSSAGKSRVSRVRSAMIEMQLDHGSGVMEGIVLSGTLQGQQLAALTRPQCEALYQTCLSDDPEGARLLEAYLDRRFAGWRATRQSNQDTGAAGGMGKRASTMSEDQAYEILGLQRSASREDITQAHRALMKKLHPDHGGSTVLAAQVNEAKDVLMRRHS
ncbi:MAG TPA: DnaJ domain-containing protein [Beijerinckiaceae bacterium]|jgi:hypothetical protein|nr:DnaJ domain-containing protein [Beijerinckiaceae bacterium]